MSTMRLVIKMITNLKPLQQQDFKLDGIVNGPENIKSLTLTAIVINTKMFTSVLQRF